MGELKTKPTGQNVESYLASLEPEDRRNDCLQLHKIIKRITGEAGQMWGSAIVGYGKYHYKSERSKQEGDWPLTAFASRKNSITIYLMGKFKENTILLEKLGKHKTSVGCLYIKKLSEVDIAILEQLITVSYAQMKEMWKS